ncbi:MAG: hypothetical protein U0795_15170 [Pirellulales bacterium]
MVGPYGNTWIETPGWNRMAAQAWLAETALLDHVSSTENLRSLFTGTHAWCRSRGRVATPAPWWQHGLPVDLESCLVTDQPTSAHSDWAERMTEVELVELPPPAIATSTDDEPSINDTQLGHFFAAVSARLSQLSEPYLLIAHTGGLLGAWDAPYSWRQTFVDEEDPDPPTWIQPPVQQLDADYDPDFLHGVRAAAGAQVMVLDQCLEALLDQLNETDQRVKLVVTSSCGWGLGEHRWIGCEGRNLHAESVHVPWLVFDPARRPLSYRSGQLMQMADGGATMRELLGGGGEQPSQGDLPCGKPSVGGRHLAGWDRQTALAITVGASGCRLQTPAWCCLVPCGDAESEDGWKLYVKPDDRWELNDVAGRCPHVVDAFRTLWQELQASGPGCFRRAELALPEILLTLHS